MRWNWEEDQGSRQLQNGSILFRIFAPASTKIQTIWIVWFQKISIPPPRKGSDFPAGRVTIGKYFQTVFVTRKRVSKKKHKNLPRQFICEDINTTKVKELLNLWINGHSEHILSVPWRDLSRENVPYGLPFSNAFGIRLNGLGYPFKNNCHPFERLWLSVREKLSSVRTAWAIRLKKIVIRSNGLKYPFEKIVIRSNGSGYPFKKEFVDRSSDRSYLFKDKF